MIVIVLVSSTIQAKVKDLLVVYMNMMMMMFMVMIPIIVTLEGSVTEVNAEHPRKAPPAKDRGNGNYKSIRL